MMVGRKSGPEHLQTHTHTNCTVNVDSAHSLTPKATILVSMIQERLKDKCVTCVNLCRKVTTRGRVDLELLFCPESNMLFFCMDFGVA